MNLDAGWQCRAARKRGLVPRLQTRPRASRLAPQRHRRGDVSTQPARPIFVSPDGQRFAPAIVGWLDGDLPVLVTEDLTGAYWPAGTGTVHWRAGDMQAVLAELRLLRAVPAGAGSCQGSRTSRERRDGIRRRAARGRPVPPTGSCRRPRCEVRGDQPSTADPRRSAWKGLVSDVSGGQSRAARHGVIRRAELNLGKCRPDRRRTIRVNGQPAGGWGPRNAADDPRASPPTGGLLSARCAVEEGRPDHTDRGGG